MRLYLPCQMCLQNRVTEQDFMMKDFRDLMYPAIYSDGGYFQFVCDCGHHNFVMLQEQKFEVLFQIGANAILDGYYREAVSSFTSSLERFYEFCVRIFSRKHGVDPKVVKQATAFYTNSSERQFGSFLFLYLIEFKKLPITKSKDKKMREFRNQVIHNGKIPSRDEAVWYGNEVRVFVLKMILLLQERYFEQIQELVIETLHEKLLHNDSSGGVVSTMSGGCILSLANGMIEQALTRNLEQDLSDIQKMREMMKIHYGK